MTMKKQNLEDLAKRETCKSGDLGDGKHVTTSDQRLYVFGVSIPDLGLGEEV